MHISTIRRGFRAAFWLLVLFAAAAGTANAATVFGVTTDNQLVRFDTATPGTVTTVGAITNLQTGENVLGIDFRPANGRLYALGSSSRLYTIDTATGAATAVGGQFSTLLTGADFGFDFNPQVDRIRVVSNTGQNLRLNPNTGAVQNVDGNLNPGTPVVTAAAYDNNFNGTTTTILYDIDTNTDTLFRQDPPNSGTLVAVGPLGVDFQAVNGFDFTSSTNTAYAVSGAQIGVGNQTLYTINLTTGAATPVGSIGQVGLGPTLRGIAVEIGATVGLPLVGLTTANNLVFFNANRPNTILRTQAVTGLMTGENLIGIDYRPANGLLYGVGTQSRIYTINTTTGAATFVATLSVPLNGTNFGFDFNPVPDRLRIVSDTDQNLRANVATGATINDGTLAYQAGDPNAGQNPNIVSAAYTNNFAGAGATTLRVIDSNLDIIATQIDPNAGTLQTNGSLGFNTTANVGYDFSSGNAAILTLQIEGSTASGLYTVNGTGGFVRAAFIGPVGGGVALRGVAVVPGSGAGRTSFDFDGDRRADLSVYRSSVNTFFIGNTSNGSLSAPQFGVPSDLRVPADYDGDGRTDIAVYRTDAASGTFFVLRSSDNTVTGFQFGVATDQPVPRDYDGDGRADFAVIRRSPGALTWFIINSSNGSFRAEVFGVDTDTPAPADYDGDGRADLAVQRAATGSGQATFFINQSRDGFRAVQFGQGADLIAPGDYDGDGRADLAVIRLGTFYTWFILQSTTNTIRGVQWGAKNDINAQADYDADGKTDITVWRPQNGVYYIIRSLDGVVQQVPFGSNGDEPLASLDSF